VRVDVDRRTATKLKYLAARNREMDASSASIAPKVWPRGCGTRDETPVQKTPHPVRRTGGIRPLIRRGTPTTQPGDSRADTRSQRTCGTFNATGDRGDVESQWGTTARRRSDALPLDTSPGDVLGWAGLRGRVIWARVQAGPGPAARLVISPSDGEWGRDFIRRRRACGMRGAGRDRGRPTKCASTESSRRGRASPSATKTTMSAGPKRFVDQLASRSPKPATACDRFSDPLPRAGGPFDRTRSWCRADC